MTERKRFSLVSYILNTIILFVINSFVVTATEHNKKVCRFLLDWLFWKSAFKRMWLSALLIPEAVFFLDCPLPLSVVQKKSDKSHTGHTWNRISDTVLQSLAFDTSGWKWWVHVALGHDSVSAAPPFSSFSLVWRFWPQGPLLICVTRSYAQSTSDRYSSTLCVLTHAYYFFLPIFLFL